MTAPFWLPLLGGYTALAGRVLVFGLAAMGLNLLLGFTGVLSFGHAAYFGLGAYGAGLTLRYLVHSTPLAMLAGTLLGGLAGMLFGLLIVRRRGVYFAMCTIAFGQIWYYIAYSWNSFTGGFDGLRDFHREPIGFGPFTLDITNGGAFYYFLLAIFAAAVALMGILLRSPFGRTLLRHPRERAPRALPRHSGRAAHLDVVLDFLLLHRACRHALRAPQQFRRSAGAALHAVGLFRGHDGDRRHAHVLGAAVGRGGLRRAAGLHFLDDGELDVVHRRHFHARRAVLPARPARHAGPEQAPSVFPSQQEPSGSGSHRPSVENRSAILA
jgi:hypothetical protein